MSKLDAFMHCIYQRLTYKCNSSDFVFSLLSKADRSGTLGVFTRSVFQWTSDRQGPPEAVRADDSDQAAEEAVSQGAWSGRDAEGVSAPQSPGVSVSVQEWALELQSGRPGKSSEKR